MAVRLQMKLGVVAEQDRLPDSPDTVVVVEPSVGSVARSKGHLYLLVTSRVPGHRAHEATRLAAETIRNEYYYDESAGIRVCIQKAIGLANKRLAHQRDRLNLGGPSEPSGPIGVGVAVVRGNELYVATVGPAEAYLIRQARLSTLPDPHRDRGLPATALEPDVWRGEISVGDSLVLISPNVIARLGPEELKDAMVTLHPQSAMEHLHHRFVAADGSGSDGGVAFEATEVAVTHKQRTLVPVRPAEPLAGAPDRSPIPLADPVVGGVAAVQAGARQARDVAGTALERAVIRMQEFLPRRETAHRRVTPATARRETQRRAAVALLAFIVVAFGLGMAVFFAPRGPGPDEVIPPAVAGQRALEVARANRDRVFAPGVDLVETNPSQARDLLTEAYAELDKAEAAGVPSRNTRPIRADVVAGLDRLYAMITVDDTLVYEFDPTSDPPGEMAAMIQGPDGVPYVLDSARNTVWRINLSTGEATRVIREGTEAAGAVAAVPRLLATGGPDLLILDASNVLWRWRPADDAGKGTTTRVRVNGAAEWGNDVVAIGTYLRDADRGLYNLYVVDPSLEQIRRYSPAADGGGFPAAASDWLNSARDVSGVSAMYIDGDVYLAADGEATRFSDGTPGAWEPELPGDELLRDPPEYRFLASASGRREGRIYAFDPQNDRVVAFDKGDTDGTFVEQYRLAEGNDGWADMRSMYVVQGEQDALSLVWCNATQIHVSRLAPISDGASPSPGASGAPDESGTPASAPPPAARIP